MNFSKLQLQQTVRDQKETKEINIWSICKFLIIGLVVSMLILGVVYALAPKTYFAPPESSTLASTVQQASEGVTAAQVLSVAFMLVPLALMIVFGTAILKNKKSRFNMAFVFPVLALGVFCFVMAVIQLALGNGYHCVAYLIFEIFAMLTLLVFNLIENRAKVNVRGAARRAGLVGVCIALIAMSFSSVFKGSGSLKDRPATELTQKEQNNK